MLPTGVTALTAHSGRHGNRDEHSYLCPDIHWLCFSDKLWSLSIFLPVLISPTSLLLLLLNSLLSFFLSCFLAFFLFFSIYRMMCSRELEVWNSIQRALYSWAANLLIVVLIALMKNMGLHPWTDLMCNYTRSEPSSPLWYSVNVFVYNHFLTSMPTAEAETSSGLLPRLCPPLTFSHGHIPLVFLLPTSTQACSVGLAGLNWGVCGSPRVFMQVRQLSQERCVCTSAPFTTLCLIV